MKTLEIVSIEDFAKVHEEGANAILGDGTDQFVAEGSDVMLYGDGGASKTTLALDAAFHLAAGDDWLGIPVARPVKVLLIENEGPRPQFRSKIERKLKSWTGSPLGGRVSVLQETWGGFDLASEECRAEIAQKIDTEEIDVVIAGPVARIGMVENGTLREVADFMQHVATLRRASGRRLAMILIHHAAKGGGVSGAWEGAVDTLLHAEARSKCTHLHVEKARWSPARHGARMKLNWTAGEGFELERKRERRNLLAEIRQLLAGDKWMTVDEIVAAIGAEKQQVRDVLEHFQIRTGEQARTLGRSPKAKLYGVGQ